MKFMRCLFLSAMIFFINCSDKNSSVEKNSEYELFAKRVFDAVMTKNSAAMIELCKQPHDVDLTGKPLMRESEINWYGYSWKDVYQERMNRFYSELDKHGGAASLQWIKMGKVIGNMPGESGFIGNMYIEVKIGNEERVIEIGSTQLSKNRGRVIVSPMLLDVKTMDYYVNNANDPQALY